MKLLRQRDPDTSFSAAQPAALVRSRPTADLRRAAVASEAWHDRVATCDNRDVAWELAKRGQR